MRRSIAVLTVLLLALGSNAALAQEAAEEEPAPKAKTEVPPETAADKAKAAAAAEAPKPTSLQDLLDLVQEGFTVERKENRDREAAFLKDKADQQRLLDQALAERNATTRTNPRSRKPKLG